MFGLEKIFKKKWNKVLVFWGRKKSVKIWEAEVNFISRKVRIKDEVCLKSPLEENFSHEQIINILTGAVSSSKKNSHLLLVLERPFLKSTLSNFSILRDNPINAIEESELENLILNLTWRLQDREKAIVARALGISEMDLTLISSAIKDPTIEGRKILNPLGFSGRRLGFTFENNYGAKDFWEELSKIVACFKCSTKIVCEDNLIYDKTFSALGEGGILVFLGEEETKIGLMGNFLKSSEKFNWGGKNLTAIIAREFAISLENAEHLRNKYAQGEMSISAKRWFEKMFAPELKILAAGIALSVKNFFDPSVGGEKLHPEIKLYGELANFPKMSETLKSFVWPKSVFKKKPTVSHYSSDEIFDKINISTDKRSEKGDFDAILAVFLANLFLPESYNPDLNKILRRRLKWIR
ncbi:MAG TPA: hypothetical protein PLQ44_02130 [Candidatus Paceibacterota bacterium]|nr:hypothetical protein [Candidatus Paceibacterota bacterium]HPT40377.1 hypothetical protein [Candidatus Paceibacterota bacterium]